MGNSVRHGSRGTNWRREHRFQSLSGDRRGVLRTDAGLVRHGRLTEPRVGRAWARATCERRDPRRW